MQKKTEAELCVDRTCPAITITPMAFWPDGDNIDEDNPWKSLDRSIQNHRILT